MYQSPSGPGRVLSEQDEQWNRAMEYVSAVSELNYLTQIVIMLYEDPTKDEGSEERSHSQNSYIVINRLKY